MKTKSILVAAWITVVLATTAHGKFVPGHVFAAQSAGKLCKMNATYGSDRIWEIAWHAGPNVRVDATAK